VQLGEQHRWPGLFGGRATKTISGVSMDALLGEDASSMTLTLAASSAVLLVLALVLAALWLIALRGRRREAMVRADAERAHLDLDLLFAEQTARLRMVRELNEVAVNSVSAIARQAEGARYAGESDPGAAVRSAVGIAESARATLDDLRRGAEIVKHAAEGAGV